MENKRINYAAIIVVYNKSIKDSATCAGIHQALNLNIEIIIVDNSENNYGNKEICEIQNYKYINMHGNKGLSKAYNAAIDCTDADVIILLDDDTELTGDYFKTLNVAVLNFEDIDIFAPVVYGQDGVIYSPNEFNFLRNHFIHSPDQEVSQESFNAIASCLAIRKRVFEHYRFNEWLFVDQVDQYFFCEQRKLNRKFMKLNTVIHQNFYQRGKELHAYNAWHRIRLRIIDIMRHAKLMGGIKYKLLGWIKCCGLSVQISIKSKSVYLLVRGIALSCKLLMIIPSYN